MNKHSPAGRRYLKRFIPTMIAYVISIFGASYGFELFDLSGPLAWALAVAPALPILAIIAIMGLYIKEETDEFQRSVLVESMLWGFGITLAITTVWGFLEMYVHTPGLQSFWAFPIFCLAMGLSQLLVRRRFR
jgi:xanthosine utilization system XapX-like protein